MKNTPGIATSSPARCLARSLRPPNRVSNLYVFSPTRRCKFKKSNVLRKAVSSASGSNRKANNAI
eukprot:4888159-Lingulodinium_polyedra.AAC.1